MGLRDLFRRGTDKPESAPATPPSDAARLSHRQAPGPAKRTAPAKTITVDGEERSAPDSFQPRSPDHVYYTLKPVESWGIVDLFDYWLDLNHNLRGDLAKIQALPGYQRPEMDLVFEKIWAGLTEKRGYRPIDVALLLRWGFASRNLEIEFERDGMKGLRTLVSEFEEKTEARDGDPVRVFHDAEYECAHAVAQWELRRLDDAMEILARTFGFPVVMATIRGLNPGLGPDLVKRASRYIHHEETFVREIALMRQISGEVVKDLPPDEFFLER